VGYACLDPGTLGFGKDHPSPPAIAQIAWSEETTGDPRVQLWPRDTHLEVSEPLGVKIRTTAEYRPRWEKLRGPDTVNVLRRMLNVGT
jgi:hypothetical protein